MAVNNTKFLIKSEESSNGALIIQAFSYPSGDNFRNTMYFSTGELVFNSNFKNKQYFPVFHTLQENEINYYFDRFLQLVFNSNFKNKYPDRRSGLNATEVISYQYLGMTKIAGALNMLPKIILRHNIINRLSSYFS
jgi:hypothetical protein